MLLRSMTPDTHSTQYCTTAAGDPNASVRQRKQNIAPKLFRTREVTGKDEYLYKYADYRQRVLSALHCLSNTVSEQRFNVPLDTL